jgi:hypothetical protein
MTVWRHAFAILTLLVGLLFAAAAAAHFNLNLNVRVFHVEHLADGLRVYLRTPMAYLVADRIGPVGADGLPEPAPFTTNRMEDGRLMHLVDQQALRADPAGLGRIAAEGLHIEAGRRPLDAAVIEARAHPIGREPGFATLAEAKAALAGGPAFPPDATETYVGDAIVDVLLEYRTGAPIYHYALSSLLDPELPGQEETANLILDHRPGGTNTYRATGLLLEPVEVSRSALAAAQTFVLEGIRHILEGPDHVLFVLCLVIGAATLRRLVGRVTGFTIGHTITLSLGFFGYVPSGAWFIPTVELGIALSIIYAAAIAFFGVTIGSSETRVMLVTGAIGLLHGLGFSFVLHEILRVDSPNVWQSLLAFNVGVEIGQIAIVLAVWPLCLLCRHVSENAWLMSRRGIASISAVIAITWVVQRTVSVAAAL